jgi:hypothetical protein
MIYHNGWRVAVGAYFPAFLFFRQDWLNSFAKELPMRLIVIIPYRLSMLCVRQNRTSKLTRETDSQIPDAEKSMMNRGIDRQLGNGISCLNY